MLIGSITQLVHDAWINYNNESVQPIIGCYCSCPNGARTLGSCSHIVSILWFLGIGKFNEMLLKNKQSINYRNYCLDAETTSETNDLIEEEFENEEASSEDENDTDDDIN